jgi:hypothetical protein
MGGGSRQCSVVQLMHPVLVGRATCSATCVVRRSVSLAACCYPNEALLLTLLLLVCCCSSCVAAVQEGEELFKSEAEAAKLAHRAAWEHDLSEKARVAKMQADREALAQQIQARRAEEFAALKVGQAKGGRRGFRQAGRQVEGRWWVAWWMTFMPVFCLPACIFSPSACRFPCSALPLPFCPPAGRPCAGPC